MAQEDRIGNSTQEQSISVSAKSFSEIVEILNDKINAICNKSYLQMDRDDIKQELLICLWKIYQKYGHETLHNFNKIASIAMSNKLIDCYRAMNRQKIPRLTFIEKYENYKCPSSDIRPNPDMDDELKFVKNNCKKATLKVIKAIEAGKKAKDIARLHAKNAVNDIIAIM